MTNLNRVGGAFPAGGADRYTFQSNVRQRFQIGVSGDAQPCPRDIVLTLFNRGAEDPLDFPQIELEGCAHLVGELAAGAYDLRVSAPADQAVDAYRLEMDWNPL